MSFSFIQLLKGMDVSRTASKVLNIVAINGVKKEEKDTNNGYLFEVHEGLN
jgi:hypothetical protein